MALDEKGREIPEGGPIEWPLGLRRPLSIQDEIRRFVQVELSRQASSQGYETLDEANDFEVEDDEGDHAHGIDVIELQADKRYEEALEEFDVRHAAEQQKKVEIGVRPAGPAADAPGELETPGDSGTVRTP